MKNVRYLPKVIEYDRYQPEFYEDTKTYISKRTSKQKSLGVFYFNNKTAIENGKKQFKLLWGNRNRIENWRVISQNIFISENNFNRSIKTKSNKLESNNFDKFKIVKTKRDYYIIKLNKN